MTPDRHPQVFGSLLMQMVSHLPAAVAEQALHCWRPSHAAESALGEGPGVCGVSESSSQNRYFHSKMLEDRNNSNLIID